MKTDEKAYDIIWFLFGFIIVVFGALTIYRYFFPKAENERVKKLKAEIKDLKETIFDLKNRMIAKDDMIKAYKSKLKEYEKKDI